MGDVEKARPVSWAVVMATGLIIGLWIWRTYWTPVPHYYPVNFQQAQWISTPQNQPQAYFRKELYISGAVQQAWVIVAATDAFTFYLNGRIIDSKGYYAMTVSGIYDMGHALRPGANVIGVLVRRTSYPGSAMAAIEGAYQDDVGQTHPFASDASWKVSETEQRQGGKIPWHENLFDATRWITAKEVGRPDASEIYPLTVHPSAFTMPQQGTWIAAPPDQTGVSCGLPLSTAVEEGWIRIVATQPYALIVNGTKVVGETTRDLPKMRDPNVSLPQEPQGMSTDLYNIHSFLKQGENQITVTPGERLLSESDLFIDGFVVRHGETQMFGTGAPWTEGRASSLEDDYALRCSYGSTPINPVFQNQVLPIKKIKTGRISFNSIQSVTTLGFILLLSVGGVLAFWRGASRMLAALQNNPHESAYDLSALVYVPLLIILGGMFLLSFDIRFHPSFLYHGFFIGLFVAALLILTAFLMIEAYRTGNGVSPVFPFQLDSSRIQYGGTLLLVSLIGIGAFLRLIHLEGQSLYHDEIHMTYFVRGLLEKGYPFKMVGDIERPLATYELIPYPIALSTRLFGFSEFAFRLPAATYGIIMIFFIYYVGKNVFDRRVGLLAAAIYTFCPQTLVWANYLWHPQQLHLFSLITAYLFYRILSSPTLEPKRFYLVAGLFILTYLSWEGVGFLLPALFLGLLVVKGRDFSWIREKHFWGAVGLVVTVIIGQLLRRIRLQTPYMMIGGGLSDVSLPIPFFLDPMYDPTVYIRNFLWLDNNVVLTVLAVSGLFLCRQHKGFAYFATILFSVLLMMTNLLAHAAIRYVYYLQTFLILTASFVVFHIVDRIADHAQRSQLFWVPRFAQGLTAVVLCIGMVVGSSTFMKMYRLTGFDAPTYGIHLRPNVYYIDYRSAARYVKKHYRPGDMVISVTPYALQHYAGIPTDYFLESHPSRQVLYDTSASVPQYLERTSGAPVISDPRELANVVSRKQRTWVIAVPYTLFSFLSGDAMNAYIREMGEVTYESYNARVYLLQS